MTFTFTNLPDQLLTPAIPAPPQHDPETWARNWSLYFIHRHWTGSTWGRFEALADWVATVTGQPRLSRQRIHMIVYATGRALRDYTDAELGIDTSAARPIHDRQKRPLRTV